MKYLEAPDIHANKRWMETTIEILEKIRLTAIKEKVDFIAVPGDLHDAGFYVSDESGYNVFKTKMKELLKVCPVVAVRGTPGHEEEGIYSPLEDLGLVLLQPGKVYGYYPEWGVKELDTGISGRSDGLCKAILFGIPELNKNNIMKELNGLSAEQGNAKVVDLFGDYIDEFIAPMRLKYKDIPAIGLIHGVISDSRKEYSTDIIIKSSDIVIDTETMGRANLDRWTIGHPHLPWESSLICAGVAGYPGIDRNPWGKRDFVPAMNLVEIGQPIKRIPYGTPMRVKLSKPLPTYDPNIAYWLDTDNPDDVLPTGHPWSRITYKENTTETRRVTAAEAESAKTLWDLFKLIDPDVRQDLKPLIDSIPARKNNKSNHKLEAVLTSIKIWGCTVLFGDKTVEWDLTELKTGLNQLIGTNGNGDGKSSALGFISWHPAIVGKDTKSGRLSAVKDFFTLPDSGYEKYGIVNGQQHHHLITIKGAHTQNPKTECYLWIDGVSQLENTAFDTMFEKCQELYGDYEDYLLTTFYEQPQQSKNQRSGLMTATGTDARNLVQNIADIDKESEKRFALDRVAEFEKEGQQLESDIKALDEYSEDIVELKGYVIVKNMHLMSSRNILKETKKKGNTVKALVDNLQLKVTDNEKAKTQKAHIGKSMDLADTSIEKAKGYIELLKETVKDLPGNQATIKKDDVNRKLKADADKLQLEYSNLLNTYNEIMRVYDNDVYGQSVKKSNIAATMDTSKRRIDSIEREKELISDPCEKCGHVKSTVREEIEKLNLEGKAKTLRVKEAQKELENFPIITKPIVIEPVKPLEVDITTLSDFERSETEKEITEGLKAETTIEGLKAGIIKDNKLFEVYQADLRAIRIDPLLDEALTTANADLDTVRHLYSETLKVISTLEAEKKALEDRIKKALEGEITLKEKKTSLTITETSFANWTYIAKMLNPDKIPALELDMVVDSIDIEATRTIEPFLEGRYSYHTVTQSQGKKTTVDKFDILIHDGETGESFSMFYTNPGNKAFYSDCYIKALIRKRNERQQRSYSPIVYDEADGPVNPLRVKAYYDIQQEYFKDEKVILVSQKDITSSYVEKIFNIEEMKS